MPLMLHQARPESRNIVELTKYRGQRLWVLLRDLSRRSIVIPSHRFAIGLTNLANLYLAQRKYAKAWPLIERLIAVQEEALGPNHPELEATLQTLAGLHTDHGDYAGAESFYQRLLEIQGKTRGPEHLDYAAALERYSLLLRKMNRKQKAAEVQGRVERILSRYRR
jgi:tetratricopeptide (TPR) repeat protein